MNLKDKILGLIPHRSPMRFITDIIELDDEHLVSIYTWTEEDCAGHFPGFPVVPGVKILESAAQAGCVAFGLYHALKEGDLPEESGEIGVFSSVESCSFKAMVRPGDTLEMRAEFGAEGFFRKPKISLDVSATFHNGKKAGEIVFYGHLSGLWIPKPSELEDGQAA